MVNMQVTKNIFKIHILFYITGLICFITGFFKNFIIFTSIILIHELGHITSALIFKWNIEKVIILPFGGITIFNERIDKSLLEEFIIAIMGPIFQIIFMIIFKENTLFYNYNKFPLCWKGTLEALKLKELGIKEYHKKLLNGKQIGHQYRKVIRG